MESNERKQTLLVCYNQFTFPINGTLNYYGHTSNGLSLESVYWA